MPGSRRWSICACAPKTTSRLVGLTMVCGLQKRSWPVRSERTRSMNPRRLLKIAGAVFTVWLSLVAARVGASKAEDLTKSSQAAQSMVLDSLDGLEIKAISEVGAQPVKVKAEITGYNG